jgi:hypothetical protein
MLQDTLPVLPPPTATIDTQKALRSFGLLMQPDSPYHLLCLVGSANTGKSHLLTKVFPFLAQQSYQARVALLDLGHESLTVPDVLNTAGSSLGRQTFQGYYAAHQTWFQRSQVTIQDSKAFLSFVSISTASKSDDDAHNRDAFLTTAFLQELFQQPEQPVLLLINHVDWASAYLKDWLIKSFVAQSMPLAHVRFVLAAHTLPELEKASLTGTVSVSLGPVRDVEEFLSYCRIRHPALEEQSVRDLARASRYVPGLFAELAFVWEQEGDS